MVKSVTTNFSTDIVFILLFFYLATNYLSITKGKLSTNAPLNYEKYNPGPKLDVLVNCRINSKNSANLTNSTKFTKTVEKVLKIFIVDLNDNPIKLQDNHQMIDVHLDTPFFSKVSFPSKT